MAYILSCWNFDLINSLSMYSQVITGYLLAGSIVGPGGFNFVSEMVQVCSSSHHLLFLRSKFELFTSSN